MEVERWEEYEDAELVVEALLGKRQAFDALVLRYRPAVLAVVRRRVPSREVAEDICQETLLRAFRALPMLRDPRRFPSWLHAIARREVIRHGPGESRAAGHTPLDEHLLDGSSDADEPAWEALERRQEREADRPLPRPPPLDRQVAPLPRPGLDARSPESRRRRRNP